MNDVPSFPYIGKESYGMTEKPTSTVSSISFGDGYRMDALKGIRPITGKWSVEYQNVPNDVGDKIWNFLIGRKCVYPFVWTNPKTNAQHVVKCREVPTRQYTSGRHQTITATYEEA